MDFPTWYRSLRGRTPHQWQTAAAMALAAGEPVSALDVMTGGGKTTFVDCWVWALAAQADLPSTERTVPLRLIWTVDRRLIVDETWESTLRLMDLIGAAASEAAVWTRERLSRFSGGEHAPLTAERLRGGVSRPRLATIRPDQPAVIVGTAAQVGSRLLGRGYGTSVGARPIEMAMVGHDALVVVDEADIAGGLVDVADRARAMWSAGRALQVVACSATLAAGREGRTIRVTDADLAGPVLGPRWSTPKPTRLSAAKLPRTKAGDDVGSATRDGLIFEAMAAETTAMITEGLQRVLVVVNTAGGARKVWRMLARVDANVMLVTGRQRDADAERTVPLLLDRMAADPNRRGPQNRPTVVVATQTIEVGADIDADGMVVECADARSMVQRGGRAGRFGGGAQVVVVPPTSGGNKVYPEAAAAMWAWLVEQGCNDFSPAWWAAHVDGRPESTFRGCPALLTRRAALAFARTNAAGGDPEPYLQVPEDDLDVSIVWRDGLAAIPDDVDRGEVAAWCEPIDGREVLEIDVRAARRWLDGVVKAGVPSLHLRGGEPVDGGLRPGDVVVVDSTAGGLDEWGWDPESDVPVVDLSTVDGGWRWVVDGQDWEDIRDGGLPVREALAELSHATHDPPVKPVDIVAVTSVRTSAAVAVRGQLDGDRNERSQHGPEVTLDGHQQDTRDYAREIAGRLGAAIENIDSCALAGLQHDCGKGHRFQTVLGQQNAAAPMAKSSNDAATRTERTNRKLAARWPTIGNPRHELASVRLAGDLLDPTARHLVLTHHGHFHGAHAPVGDPHGVDQPDWVGGIDPAGADHRTALIERHGPWGVAWLETILRAADVAASTNPRRP